MKVLGENIRENLCYLGLGKDLLAMTPNAQFLKEKKDKLNLLKLKNFCSLKYTVKN